MSFGFTAAKEAKSGDMTRSPGRRVQSSRCTQGNVTCCSIYCRVQQERHSIPPDRYRVADGQVYHAIGALPTWSPAIIALRHRMSSPSDITFVHGMVDIHAGSARANTDKDASACLFRQPGENQMIYGLRFHGHVQMINAVVARNLDNKKQCSLSAPPPARILCDEKEPDGVCDPSSTPQCVYRSMVYFALPLMRRLMQAGTCCLG